MAQIHALTPDGRLPSAAVAHVQEIVPHRAEEIPPAEDWLLAETDTVTGRMSRAVDEQGRTWLSLHPDTRGLNGEHLPYDVVLLIGQSNMKGQGKPLTEPDPVPGVDQYPAANKPEAGRIVPAVEPLLHQGPVTAASGTGLGIPFARAYRAANPGRRVLLVPAAWGATGFSTSAPAQGGTWDWTAPDDGTNLAANAVRQTQDALDAAGDGARLAGILWHQGEGDGSIAEDYHEYLDGLIGWLRTELDAPEVPFVVGQMSPDRQGGGTHVTIDAAHQQTPSRVERTGFVPSPAGLHNPGDQTHLSTRAFEIIGPRFVDGLKRASRNVSGVAPIGVENLRAAYTGAAIRVSWDAAWCRVTEYRVEWRLPGGAWGTSGVTHTIPLGTTASFPAPVGSVEVRVIVVNEAGESAPVSVTTAGAAQSATTVATITPAADWQTTVQTDIKAYRSGSVVTIAAWRLAANTGVTGDTAAYTIPEGYRPPNLYVDDTEDTRGANVILSGNAVRVTNPSTSVSHHSWTYVTTDPMPGGTA